MRKGEATKPTANEYSKTRVLMASLSRLTLREGQEIFETPGESSHSVALSQQRSSHAGCGSIIGFSFINTWHSNCVPVARQSETLPTCMAERVPDPMCVRPGRGFQPPISVLNWSKSICSPLRIVDQWRVSAACPTASLISPSVAPAARAASVSAKTQY